MRGEVKRKTGGNWTFEDSVVASLHSIHESCTGGRDTNEHEGYSPFRFLHGLFLPASFLPRQPTRLTRLPLEVEKPPPPLGPQCEEAMASAVASSSPQQFSSLKMKGNPNSYSSQALVLTQTLSKTTPKKRLI